MDVAIAAPFIQNMTYEASAICADDFPKTEEPVWILGKQYSALYDMDEIKHDILSRMWFTYRKGFSPIGGTGPTSDQGWGCMLRCGQMMLAQALLTRHMGRDWRWYPDKYVPKYYEILQMFRDKKGCAYSIHQIASMGASEGKQVGEWFGPNTIAQVIKKLAVYDEWSNLAVHVALDNTVIMDDVRQLCRCSCQDCLSKQAAASSSSSLTHRSSRPPAPSSQPQGAAKEGAGATGINGTQQNGSHEEAKTEHWKPLLLIIPLRLGLTEINSVYTESLKRCLQLPQSVGIIGGKPNHAHYFIGSVENLLVYLDPHTTQQEVDFLAPNESDVSYHCPYNYSMPIEQLDPSIALGFYCGSAAEFDDLCLSVQKFLCGGKQGSNAMFEIHAHRPRHWGSFQPYTQPRTGSPHTAAQDFDIVEADRQFDSDDEFELL